MKSPRFYTKLFLLISLILFLLSQNNPVDVFANSSPVSAPPLDGWLRLNSGSNAKSLLDSELSVGDGSFTVEFWVFPAVAFSSPNMLHLVQQHTTYDLGYTTKANTFPYGFSFFWMRNVSGMTTVYTIDYPWGKPFSGWDHVALVYDKTQGQMSLFFNGNLNKTVPTTVSSSTKDLIIGPINAPGYVLLDEFRISDNVRYTSSFSPALAPFSCDVNTKTLWHFDEFEGSTEFNDPCGKNNVITGANGAYTEGVTASKIYLPLMEK